MSELDEIRARADAASKGPWHEFYVPNMRPDEREYGDWIIDSVETFIASTHIWTDRGKLDAEFIAHARTDVPRLVAAVDEVLALHSKVTYASFGTTLTVCGGCEGPWPCATRVSISAHLEAMDE